MFISNRVGVGTPADYNKSKLSDMPGPLGALVGYNHPLCGPQVYRVIQVVQSGGMSAGELAKRAASVAVTVDGTCTARRLYDGSAFTADAHQNDLIAILDDAGAGGADPEGDVRRIGRNTANDLYLADGQSEFSATPATGDTGGVLRLWKGIDATGGTVKADCLGVLPCDVTENDYTLALCWGLTASAKVKAATGAGDPIVADAAIVGPVASDEVKLQIGYCYCASHAGEAGVGGLIHIDLLSAIGLEEA